ncbi:hypothetical protein EOM81_10875 [bacterium]|nr:hypothetical protein [bacterium]
MNFENMDALDILFGEEAAAYFAEMVEIEEKNNAIIAANISKKIIDLMNKKKALIAKKYKNNNTKIVFGDIDDDRDDEPRGYTIARINEIKRNKKVNAMVSEINALMEELKAVSPLAYEVAKMVE